MPYLKLCLETRPRATPNVTEMVAVAREHGMKLWMAFGSFLEPWAHSHAGNRDASVEAMRYGIAMLEEQGVSLYGPLLGTALANAEAEASQFEAALATIDRAIAATERSGQRWYEAETHRIRGKILLKRDPANTAPADEAFLTAIAVAQGRRRGASSSMRRCRWRSFINRPAASPMPMPRSLPRSQAFRRRRSFRRLPKRKHSSPPSLRPTK